MFSFSHLCKVLPLALFWIAALLKATLAVKPWLPAWVFSYLRGGDFVISAAPAQEEPTVLSSVR
jgi:hypothetical protein